MLSIVYITCNRCEELISSINSCENAVSIEHEYVIVDNGSKDDTAKMIKRLSEDLPIRYLLQDTNKGVSGGRNIGYREAKGDICYFIDDDAVIVSEGKVLDSAYHYMKKNADVYAMVTDAYDTERKTRLVGYSGRNKTAETGDNIRNYIGCSHFIKKESPFVRNKELYPSNLMYGSEELFAGLSIYSAGGRVVQYNELKVLHQPSKSTRDTRRERQRNGHINTYVIKRYFLPLPFSIFSTLMFLLRISRFEQISLKRIIKDLSLMRERTN